MRSGIIRAMNKPLAVLVALAGIVAVVLGIRQIGAGVSEMQGDGTLSVDEAKEIAREGLAELAPAKAANHPISVSFPRSWETATPAEGAYAIQSKTRKGVINANVVQQEVGEGTTLDAFFEQNLAEVESALQSGGMEPKRLPVKDLELGGRAAKRLAFEYRMAEPAVDLRMTQVVVLAGKRVVYLTFTAPRDVFDELAPLFAAIEASLRVDE